MKIGEVVYVRGTVDEIRKDVVIIKNAGGYFGTVPEEIETDVGNYSDKLWRNSRNRAFDKVLEIIDDMCRDEETGYVISRKMVYVLASELRDRVLALKGGEQE